MKFTRNWSLRLFRFQGIEVFVNWTWLLGLFYWMHFTRGIFSSPIWQIVQYMVLYAIVLTHEFGHAFACRQVGGHANEIMLWPLGGVAFVDPPQRPGAMLWSIAAGPLVNVAIVPIFGTLWLLSSDSGFDSVFTNAHEMIKTTFWMNLLMLGFNLLPIYPLDGGQILRSLLWFPFGRARSLVAATTIGLIGFAVFIGVAVLVRGSFSPITVVMLIFIVLVCGSGLLQGVALLRIGNAPRRDGFACPSCGTLPPIGLFWRCGRCRKNFDIFATLAICPNCAAQYGTTMCPECRVSAPIQNWMAPPRH